jgi:hypothetical protein
MWDVGNGRAAPEGRGQNFPLRLLCGREAVRADETSSRLYGRILSGSGMERWADGESVSTGE